MNVADGFAAVQSSEQANAVNAEALQTLCLTENEFVMPGFGPAARTGVLLVHGLTGTPAEMRVLGKGLNRQGFTVEVIYHVECSKSSTALQGVAHKVH